MADLNYLIETLALAIGQEEGFFAQKKIPTIPQRLNNPGDLRSWKAPNGKPYPVANGFACFPDAETGWAALRTQCRLNVVKRKLTLREFFGGKRADGRVIYAGFAPAADKNNSYQYASNVLRYLARKGAVPAEATIDQVLVNLVGVA
jgi:hypothetical protein